MTRVRRVITQDSDERACAYIAGCAPNRWGNFTPSQQQQRAAGEEVVPPLQLSASPTPEEVAKATAVRRAHPLYASTTLGAPLPACCDTLCCALLTRGGLVRPLLALRMPALRSCGRILAWASS